MQRMLLNMQCALLTGKQLRKPGTQAQNGLTLPKPPFPCTPAFS